MPISINGTGSITGLSAGGLPDASVTAADLASGAARSNFGAGAVLQVIQTVKSDVSSTTSTSYSDISGMSVSITPASTINKVLVIVDAQITCDSNGYLKLQANSSDIYVGDSASGKERVLSSFYSGTSGTGETYYSNERKFQATFLHSPSTISAVTYKLVWRVWSGTAFINRTFYDDSSQFNGRCASSITVMEIAG